MSSNQDLPEIPKEWNLTEEQRASMKAAQQKIIDEENRTRVLQQQHFDKIMQHASMKPPEYPIFITVKENDKITRNFFLTDSSQNFVYASSFADATSKVNNDLLSANSILQKRYGGKSKLRLSSDNKNSSLDSNNFSLLPNNKFKQWVVATTNAAPSLMSSFRMSMQRKGGRRRTRKNNSRKSKKSKNNRKRKSKSKRRH